MKRKYKRKPGYKRPDRLCTFCNKMQKNGTLSRHIRLVHKNNATVKTALKMKQKDRRQRFENFKVEGIFSFNREQACSVQPVYQRAKRADIWQIIVCCGSCKQFIASRGLSRHLKTCKGDRSQKVVSVPAALLEIPCSIEIDNDFKNNILAKFRDNEVGKLCVKDECILQIGMIFYGRVKRKADKSVQVRKTVRIEMRRLGNLYSIFQGQPNVSAKYRNAHDMFAKSNFTALRAAIEVYSSSLDGKLKPGLNQNLYYLLKRSAKALKAILMCKGGDEEATEIGRSPKC